MIALALGLERVPATVAERERHPVDGRRPDPDAGPFAVRLGTDGEAAAPAHQAEASGCAPGWVRSAPIRLPTLSLVSRSKMPMAMTTNAATARRAVG